ncbi:MAG: HD-GYP domain-containing protein [Lachnospiraceae bacterium]|nr:HD-GYP domain-containing protein [Lachnospiraceae bacterium]
MKYIRPDDLESGMILATPVYDEKGLCLLAANKALTNDIILKLQERHCGLYIFDEFSEYEEFNIIISDETRNKIMECTEHLKIDSVVYYSNMIVDSLLKQENILMDTGALKEYDESIYEHSLNVAMLATNTAIGMGLSNEELQHVAQAALLHDIGKQMVPLEILNKEGILTPEEYEVMKSHPRFGYDMLYTDNRIHPEVRSAVLCHHENYNGTGYPNELSGNNIPLIARIIRIADTYDAMYHKRSYKNPLPASEVLEYLMSNNGTLFDLSIMQVFLQYIVLYPVGTDVTLSNGERARVIKNRAKSINRPVVMTLKDKKKYDLAKDPDCFSITILDNQKMDKDKERAREETRLHLLEIDAENKEKNHIS